MPGFCYPAAATAMASAGSYVAPRRHLPRTPVLVNRRPTRTRKTVAFPYSQGWEDRAVAWPRSGCGASASLPQCFVNLRNWRQRRSPRNCGPNHCCCSICFASWSGVRTSRQFCVKFLCSRKVPRTGPGWLNSNPIIPQFCPPQSVSAAQSESADIAVLQNYLRQIRTAMGLQDYGRDEHLVLTGTQQAWGMEGAWTMTWCMDGRFHEQFESEDYTHEWAYDGFRTWYADAGGRVQKQELDSHEVCLLVSWGRMGFWATEDGQRHLDIQLEPEKSSAAPGSGLVLTVRLKNMKVVAHIVVDKGSWLPLSMSIQAFGGTDKWTFTTWRNILPGRSCKLATTGIHLPPTGGQETFDVVKVEVANAENSTQAGARYSHPASLVVPRYNAHYPCSHLDTSCPNYVTMTVAQSGHFLVQPLVDGKSIGAFIVDTGASNLAISSKKARELEMHNFGDVSVSGVSGMVKSQFARGQTFQLGPFKMKDPAFLEVPIDEVLKGVVGICGYEIFFGGIVEMSVLDRTLSLHDPLQYEASFRGRDMQWQKMYLFEGIPHVTAKINGREVLLLLDTGAGGTDLMIYSRFAEGFNLQRNGALSIKGINTEGMEVAVGQVERLEFAGYTFHDVPAYLIDETEKQFVSSVYCSGILCGKMVQNFLMVFDYSKGRMALLDQRLQGHKRIRPSS